MKIACIAAFLICSLYSVRTVGSEEKMSFGKFGDIAVYSESKTPSHVVLLVSGDGGWKKGVVSMAMRLATMDTLVVGIDIVHYLKQLVLSPDGCSYPAADFEALSKFIQKKRNFPEYITPALMGYSSGGPGASWNLSRRIQSRFLPGPRSEETALPRLGSAMGVPSQDQHLRFLTFHNFAIEVGRISGFDGSGLPSR
jgi:type IV secretory pathway VirJ component